MTQEKQQDKQIVKRLTFTGDQAERSLLSLADELVAQGEFASFNELCKAALQAFLQPAPQSAALAVASEEPPAAPVDEALAQMQAMLAGMQNGQQALHAQLNQWVAQVSGPAASDASTEQLASIEQGVAALSADQQQIMGVVQQLAAQWTGLETDSKQLQRESAQRFDELHAGQQTLAAAVQQVAAQLTAISASSPQREQTFVARVDDLQRGQQALTSEVAELRELLVAEIAKLQIQRPQPASNGEHKADTTLDPAANGLALSSETINRLARFLEDF